MRKYYKVVWDYGYRLTSTCQTPDFPAGLRVEYKIGKWAKPVLQGSRLFVFNSLDNACRFCNTMANTTVYECEVQGGVGIPKQISPTCYIRQFWSQKLRKRKVSHRWTHILKGTRSVAAVKLVREVHRSPYGWVNYN